MAGPRTRRLARSRSGLGLALIALLAGACSTGTSVTWPHEGKLRFEGGGEPGREQGLWSWWYKNGQLREQGEYRNERRAGVWTQWFRSGQRANQGERVWNAETGGSEREGAWTFWHENGQLRARGSFAAGKRQGAWEYWNDAGEVDAERSGTYEDDVRRP